MKTQCYIESFNDIRDENSKSTWLIYHGVSVSKVRKFQLYGRRTRKQGTTGVYKWNFCKVENDNKDRLFNKVLCVDVVLTLTLRGRLECEHSYGGGCDLSFLIFRSLYYLTFHKIISSANVFNTPCLVQRYYSL